MTRRLPIAIERAALRAAGALPAAAKRRIAGPPRRRDGLTLDLDTQMLLRLRERVAPVPHAHRTLAQVRADMRRNAAAVSGPKIPLAHERDLTVQGADGPLPARLYTPQEASGVDPGPLVVYYHGGGWVCGEIDTHDQPCRALARAGGVRVLSVEYRLAPEHPFPAPIQDAIASFTDVATGASGIAVDGHRLAVAGDSAGAHLATVTARAMSAGDGPTPAFQLLIYPVTDLVSVSESRRTFASGFVPTRQDMEWYESQFLGELGDRRDPLVSPLLAEDLSGCPPALVLTAGFDPLRDEGEAYAEALRTAGVEVILRRFPGYIHGFANMFAVGRGTGEALAEAGGVLRAALAR